MFRPNRLALFVALGLLSGTLGGLRPLAAQDEEEAPRRSKSLSERLAQFRQDLLGQPKVAAKPTPKVNSSNTKSSRPRAGSAERLSTSQRTLKPEAPPETTEAETEEEETADKGSEFVEVAPQRAKPNISSGEPTPAGEEAENTRQPNKPATRLAKLTAPREKKVEAEDTSEESASHAVVEPAKDRFGKGNVLFTSKNPLLSVEATGPSKVLIGREAAFSIVVRNVGEVPASNVLIRINIPASAEVTLSQATQGDAPAPAVSEKASILEWRIDHLDLKARETLQLKIIPRKSAPLDLGTQWTCSQQATQATVEVQEPKLGMSISGPREVFYGQTKIYKLTLSNPGNGDAENVTLNLLPAGGSSDSPANQKIGLLRAGESKSIDIELTARQAGVMEIRAQATGEGGLRSEATEQVVVRRALLKVAVTGPKLKYAGTPSSYRLQVANAGDAIAENVEVSALLPAESRHLASSNGGKLDASHSRVLWNVGTLQPGEERTLDVQCALGSPGDNSLQVLAAAAGDLNASASAMTHVEALADLKLEVRDPQGPVAIGEDAQYEIIVRNRGTKAAEGIDLVAFFSEGLEATAVQGAEHRIAPGQVVVKTIPSLGPGSEAVIHVHAQADRSGNLVFRTELTCQNPGTKLSAEETTHFYGGDKEGEGATGLIPSGQSSAGESRSSPR